MAAAVTVPRERSTGFDPNRRWLRSTGQTADRTRGRTQSKRRGHGCAVAAKGALLSEASWCAGRDLPERAL
jgi:hypothetical protein